LFHITALNEEKNFNILDGQLASGFEKSHNHSGLSIGSLASCLPNQNSIFPLSFSFFTTTNIFLPHLSDVLSYASY
jgi:hypothetical protein